ncbi:hypothetical protein ACTXG6_01080 [Pseudonocardia sp. Cha107L01]|uniref:hypothetical protein n=1 Tax=Pseudonocardia sp. Cha107L01 TaxID=3457576 RepID=UPI00403E8B5E
MAVFAVGAVVPLLLAVPVLTLLLFAPLVVLVPLAALVPLVALVPEVVPVVLEEPPPPMPTQPFLSPYGLPLP